MLALGGQLGGRGEPTQHVVNGTLLAKSSQTVQHAPHPSPESTGLHEGPAGERATWPRLLASPPGLRAPGPGHSPGLLQTVQAEGDTTRGLCAEPKAAQTLPLWHS